MLLELADAIAEYKKLQKLPIICFLQLKTPPTTNWMREGARKELERREREREIGLSAMP